MSVESILEITSSVAATLDSAKVLNIIVRKVAEATNAMRCSILFIANGNEGYVLASHDNPAVRDLKIDLSKYPEIREAINTKSVIVLEDMVNHRMMNEVREFIKELEGASAIVVPIVFNDEVLGTIFLRARKKGRGFTKKEVDFCRVAANSCCQALKNARRFEKVVKEKERLAEIAARDSLTSLYNRNFFYSRLEEEFERAVRHDTPLSLIMMDIDGFKQVNDSDGHRVGDDFLKELAGMIKDSVRKADVLARYGGDEFAMILPHTGLKGASDKAERIRLLIETHPYEGFAKNKITMSLGVASYPGKGIVNFDDLVKRADEALYLAKREGRNCVRCVEKNSGEELTESKANLGDP